VYQTSRKRILAGFGHRCPIAHGGSARRRPLLLATVPVVTGGDDDTCGQALDVPLKRRRQRLIEVVEIEDSRRSGAAKMPKFDRCASPQHCTRNSVVGVRDRSHAMIAALPR
jgi:hypothetical protein